MQFAAKLYRYYSEYGNSSLNHRQKTVNRFHNRGLLAAMLGIVSTLCFSTAYAVTVYTGSDSLPGRLDRYALVYYGLQGGFLLFTLFVFKLKNRLHNNLLLYYTYIPLHIAYIFLFSLLLGEGAGFYWFALIFLFIPVYAPVSGFTSERALRIKSGLFLFYSLLVVAGFIFTLKVPAVYPLPDGLTSFSYTAIVLVVFGYLFINTAFMVWHFNLAPRFLQTIDRLSGRHLDLVNETRRKAQRVSNQGLLILIALTVIYLIFTAALNTWSVMIDRSHLVHTAFITGPIVLLLAFLVYAFKTPRRAGRNLFFESLAFLFIVSLLVYYSLLFGWQSRLHLLLLSALPVPLYFNGLSRLLRGIVFTFIIFLLAFVLYEMTAWPALVALPQPVIAFLGNSITALLVLSALATVIFITVRFQLVARFRRYWQLLTWRGDFLFESELDRKYRRIASALTVFAFQLSVLIGLLEIGLYFHMSYKLGMQNEAADYLWFYMWPTLATLPVYLGTLYYQGKTTSYMPAVVSLWAGLAFCLFLGVAHDMGTLLFMTPLFALPLPFMGFPITRAKARPIIFMMVCLYIAAVFGGYYILEEYGALKPLPDLYTRPIRYVVMVFFVGCALGSTLIAFRHAGAAEENLEEERKKSDSLLLNILPAGVARELKDKGYTLPVSHPSVTVLFTDFVGFTRSSRTMQPEKLVRELDSCFGFFDNLMPRHRLEKLKTIGDAYMCAGGIPEANDTHAVDACLAALRIRDFMQRRSKLREEKGEPFWQIRIGLHTGPLVAGVVGARKFAYDVWGDTVNIASRMESGGAPGTINISRSTYDLVSPFFECEERGLVAVKGAGEVEMFFITRLKEQYSRDKDGLSASNELWQKLKPV